MQSLKRELVWSLYLIFQIEFPQTEKKCFKDIQNISYKASAYYNKNTLIFQVY